MLQLIEQPSNQSAESAAHLCHLFHNQFLWHPLLQAASCFESHSVRQAVTVTVTVTFIKSCIIYIYSIYKEVLSSSYGRSWKHLHCSKTPTHHRWQAGSARNHLPTPAAVKTGTQNLGRFQIHVYLYVCMYIYIHTVYYIYIYIYMCVCLCIIYIESLYIYIYTHIYLYVKVCAYMYIYQIIIAIIYYNNNYHCCQYYHCYDYYC